MIGVRMKKIFSVFALASMLITVNAQAIEATTESEYGGAILTAVAIPLSVGSVITSFLLKADTRDMIANAIEESEQAGHMTPALKSFVEDIKSNANFKGTVVSDEEVIFALENAFLQ
jgi:hypothetical protein